MAKLPWLAFYAADHLTDTRPLTVASRGVWIDCICHLWRSPTPGTLTFSHGEWARLIGITVEEFRAALDEFRAFSICDIEEDSKGLVRLSSRRMLRDETARRSNAEHQRRHRHKAKVMGQSDQSKPESHSQSQNHNHSQSQSHNQNHNHVEPPPSPPHGGRSESRPVSQKGSRTTSEDNVPIALIVSEWNALPGVHEFEGQPGKHTRRRLNKLWTEHSDLRWFRDYFRRIAGTNELTGWLDSGFHASLTWALEQRNVEKVLSGHYGEPQSIEAED